MRLITKIGWIFLASIGLNVNIYAGEIPKTPFDTTEVKKACGKIEAYKNPTSVDDAFIVDKELTAVLQKQCLTPLYFPRAFKVSPDPKERDAYYDVINKSNPIIEKKYKYDKYLVRYVQISGLGEVKRFRLKYSYWLLITSNFGRTVAPAYRLSEDRLKIIIAEYTKEQEKKLF